MTAWTEVSIRDDGSDGAKWRTSDALRTWMESKHGELLPPKKVRTKFVIVLKIEGGHLFGEDVVAYLRDKFGVNFRQIPKARHYDKQHAVVRRRMANVLKAPKPKFRLVLDLLDPNQLFDAVGGGDPWDDAGVRQRLQALGYLYTPLTHPTIATHARKCWDYYKAIRDRAAGNALTNAEVVADLKREIKGNLLTAAPPASGVINDASALPAADRFAALRFPGGYCVTRSPTSDRVGGDFVLNNCAASNPDVAYQFRIGDPRSHNEDKVFADNDKFGRYPIRARVIKRWSDGREVAVADAPVIFALVDPLDIPLDSPLAPEPLPHKVMDYRVIGALWGDATRPNAWGQNQGLNADEWKGIWRIAHAAWDATQDRDAANTQAEQWIDAWHGQDPVNWGHVSAWWGDQAELPYAKLRAGPGFATKAKERVNFLLGEREAAQAHVAEVSNIGQHRFMAQLMATVASQLDDDDPQRFNAPEADYAGKAGGDIGLVFTKGASALGFEDVTDPDDAVAHPHAVQCKTNARGYAGVVFTPSRCGGDRYRIQASIDPEWLRLQSSGGGQTQVRTGTMVVWRNIRLGKYLRLPAPQVLSATMQTLLDWGNTHDMDVWFPHSTTSVDYSKMALDTPLIDLDVFAVANPEAQYAAVNGAAAAANVNPAMKMRYRPVPVIPDGFNKQFRRGYCELIDDAGGAITPITRLMLNNALTVGKRAWEASGKFAKRIDWDSLIVDDATSPFVLTFHSFHQYNTLTAGTRVTYPALDMGDSEHASAAMHVMLEAMLEFLAGSGVEPGITVCQIARGQTWDFRALNIATVITSGYGTASRAFWLSHTRGVYHGDFWAYSATSNALHEIGHVLGLCHQPPAGADIEDSHQLPMKTAFQRPSDDQTVCVMSYSGCYGDYCGKCLLALRGWKALHDGNQLYQ